MEGRKELKHRVLEVLEGGLRGNTIARIFSWTLIILILLSITFFLIWDIERFEPYHETFEIIETITVGIFTLELILGFWTADIRFKGHPRPHWRYMIDFMTNIQILAILPFYLGLVQHERFIELAEFFQFLKLLHLLKIGEIGLHAHRGKMEEKKRNESRDQQ